MESRKEREGLDRLIPKKRTDKHARRKRSEHRGRLMLFNPKASHLKGEPRSIP